MLVELAIGDAYGAGFEYANPAFIAAHNDLSGYVQHPSHQSIKPGAYTDDTQMTLAIAELLADGSVWTAEALADKFVEVFKRDERQGYAGGFYLFLCDIADGAEFLSRIKPDSDKSGAAMRAGPLGLLPTVADVLHHTAIQARVTHDTPAGVSAAQAAALAVHYCHYSLGPVADVATWIDRQLGTSRWSQPWQGKVGSKGWMSTRAALTALASSTSMSSILSTSVAFTGDVDTVATIALAAASRSPEITADLPSVLVENLENGTYGGRYLADLDSRLLSRFS
jgi:ADP-ribosylglycohydrolase